MNLAAKTFGNGLEEETRLDEKGLDYKITKRFFGLWGEKRIIVTGYNYHGRWKFVHGYNSEDILNGEDGEGELILTSKENPNLKKV